MLFMPYAASWQFKRPETLLYFATAARLAK
jgi:hypothetical protein